MLMKNMIKKLMTILAFGFAGAAAHNGSVLM